ncbi:hypothetical protein BaRGS_00001788 [Batillaria attramentaria]|uniref:C2HC/C3H-type domain-containing protein n=1 Tax=Batillaria attramentaria TaxID=370345 RepID=A0ABD0M6L7_9CAEN
MSRAAVDAYRHQNSYGSTMKHSPRVMNPGRGGGPGGDQKPSKLLQMRDDYQRRLLQEKEERMIHMYEDNQRRNMDRLDRVTGKAGDGRYPNSRLRQPGHAQPQGGVDQMGSSTSVRDFFRERREMEAKGGYVPPINHHYRQARGRTGSGSSLKKNSAGIDRAQPLAPIQARHSTVSSAPAETPFNNRPRLVKHHLNSTHTRRDGNNNEAADDIHTNTPPNKTPGRGGPPAGNKKASTSPKGAPPGMNKRSPAEKEEKLSDFQKWQMEQTKAREERLKKLNMRAPRSGREREREEEEEMRTARAGEERREAENLKRQQAAEKERRRKQQQEEARQRREDEARAKREEEEQRRAAARAQPPQRQRYDPSRYNAHDGGDEYEDPQHSARYVSHEPTPRSNKPTPRKPPQQQQQRASRAAPPPRRAPSPPQEEEDIVVPGPGVDFYASVVDDGSGRPGRLVPCKLCGRKFADDRIAKHQNACKNAQKKRKTFDGVQMRTDGTDMAKYVRKGAHTKDPPQTKKKADWRRQHEDFVNAIRYAKKMTQMEQQGVALKDLPPPPPSHNPDLVPCPHCGRKFNDTAAERHIPRCKELKTRPVARGRR